MTGSLVIAYMNVRGQTGLDINKQVQIEKFLIMYKIDILMCQETHITSESFKSCGFISKNFEVISNNANSQYGTCCLIKNCFQTENVKCDTDGRVICFDIKNVTFCNVYLPSGNDSSIRDSRENFSSSTIPNMLVNRKESGCVGGDWNCVISEKDATSNASQKMSSSLKSLVAAFKLKDSYRIIHPKGSEFSRYYDHNSRGVFGATRLDRQYTWGHLTPLEATHVSVAFSDHLSLIVKMSVPDKISNSIGPKFRSLFKANPSVVKDELFYARLSESMCLWKEIKQSAGESLDIVSWWEIIVKPGIKKLLINRGKEINLHNKGHLNLLLLRQAYLVSKLHDGELNKLRELSEVKSELNNWYIQAAEKVKLQSRCEEIDSPEDTRVYHHELHNKQIKNSSILKLATERGTLYGHADCATYLEDQVKELLINKPDLCLESQEELLKSVRTVFTEADNALLDRIPTMNEVKDSLWSSKLHAAPGTDGLTNFLYKHCWDILGQSLTEVVQAVHTGCAPSLSQRTSLMVYGAKVNKPPNSTDPKHKRRISLLNSDFKIMSGIYTLRFNQVATHTLNPNQYAKGHDRRIHQAINKARDAIYAMSESKSGCGILDNDYMSAFDLMVLTWVFKVMKAKGLKEEVIERLRRMYDNHLTVVVVNNVQGRCFPNHRWSIRQGDRPSDTFFCYGLDPHLDWLESRLKGIQIYRSSLFDTSVETYKFAAYVDDVKPGVTNLKDFVTIDEGSSLFERASGCRLHRDPNSGKVKFLPLGSWKGTISIADLPIKYIAISNHLDMIGVKLMANYSDSRKINCDALVKQIQVKIGAWRGGRFMSLCDRPTSINTYGLSKAWFKCASINLRVSDFSAIDKSIKSWVFRDLAEKPEKMVQYRKRSEGGLGMVHVQYKSLSLLIRSFLETAANPNFSHNGYHVALFKWFVEGKRNIIKPVQPPYYNDLFFKIIRKTRDEGSFDIRTMTSGMWYRVLIEENITHDIVSGKSELIPCRTEALNPTLDWSKIWRLVRIRGLTPQLSSFAWKMIHNLVPSPARLFDIKYSTVKSNTCQLCPENQIGDLSHLLLTCSFNNGIGISLWQILRTIMPSLQLQEVILFNFTLHPTMQLPVAIFVSTILFHIWSSRQENRICSRNSICSSLQATVTTLKNSSRNSCAAEPLRNLVMRL